MLVKQIETTTLIVGCLISSILQSAEPRGIDRVAPAAQQLWAEALVEGWPALRDEGHAAAIRQKISEAVSKAGYPPPILVSLAELESENDRAEAIQSLQLNLLRPAVEDSGGPLAASDNKEPNSAVAKALEDGIPRLLATSTDSTDRFLLLALQSDPAYLPALERLAWSEQPKNRTFALAELRRIAPSNALPWLIEAAFLIREQRFGDALPLIERAIERPALTCYPPELPQRFQLTFPEGALAREVGTKANLQIAGMPISPVVLSNMRCLVADMHSVFRPSFFQTARSFRYWVRDEIENAARCGDVQRIRRLNRAMRGLGRLLILQTPQDGLSIVGGEFLVRASLEGAMGSDDAVQRVLDAGKTLREAWRENYNQIDPQRLGRDGLPVWLTGELDREAALQAAAANAISSSKIVEALDALPASIDNTLIPAPQSGCLPSTNRCCPASEYSPRERRRMRRAQRSY